MLNQRISDLQALARDIEDSNLPSLEPIDQLPEIIRQRRTALGLATYEAAELAGVSRTTWSALEREGANPRLKTLIEAGETLNLRFWVERL